MQIQNLFPTGYFGNQGTGNRIFPVNVAGAPVTVANESGTTWT